MYREKGELTNALILEFAETAVAIRMNEIGEANWPVVVSQSTYLLTELLTLYIYIYIFISIRFCFLLVLNELNSRTENGEAERKGKSFMV